IIKGMWLIIGLSGFISCVNTDDFEIPLPKAEEPVIEGNLTTIATVKSHYSFQANTIYNFRDTNAYFVGYVISSDESGNFYKKLIVQDKPSNPGAGIQILVDDTA